MAEYAGNRALLRNLPRLLKIDDREFQYKLRSVIRHRRWSEADLEVLVAVAHQTQDTSLNDAIVASVVTVGGAPGMYGRQALGLWEDELCTSKDVNTWRLGVQLFLATGAGTPEVAANGSRRHLAAEPELASRVLGEVGCIADVPSIWQAAHRGQPKNQASYASFCWIPIIRLTETHSEAN